MICRGRIAAVLATGVLAWAGASADAVSAQVPRASAAGPPMPFEDRGACPFEGCVYREWTAHAAVDLHRDRDARSPILFRLRAREKATALTGVVVTVTPGRVQFREPRDLAAAPRRIHIEPGQTLFLLTYQGEGFTKAWFQGEYYTDVDTAEFLNAACSLQPSRCAGKVVAKGHTDWWVQIRNTAGAVGWTNEPEKFDGKDALGGGSP